MAELLAAKLIRDIADFPKPGIIFKDISPVLQNPLALKQAVEFMALDVKAKGAEVVVGIESRGFIFGVPIALELGLPFVMTRKVGKLPYKTIQKEYSLEYGTAKIEMHVDSLEKGQKAYIIDDLLATGGTAAASAHLVEALGGEVCGFGFMVELGFLNGRDKLQGYEVCSLINF